MRIKKIYLKNDVRTADMDPKPCNKKIYVFKRSMDLWSDFVCSTRRGEMELGLFNPYSGK